MKRDEIRKLVGGYATGTLTDAERALLFEAALDDQDLFDELAGEHALKELLEEPGVRQRLADSLAPELVPALVPVLVPVLMPASVSQRIPWWMRPWPVSALGAAALGLLIMVSLLRPPETHEIAAVTSAPVSPEVQSNADVSESRLAAPPSAPSKDAPAPASLPAPAPGSAPTAPPAVQSAQQAVGALAPAENGLRKDAGNTAPAPEARKAEAPPPPVQAVAPVQPRPAVPPARANESDRKEQTLADAVEQPAQQQQQQKQQQEQQQQQLQSRAVPQQGPAAAQQNQAAPQQSPAALEQNQVATQQSAATPRQSPTAAPQTQAAAQQGQPAQPQTLIAPATQAVVVTEQTRAGLGGAAPQNPPGSPAPTQTSPPAAKSKLALSRQGAAKVGTAANALPAFTWSIVNSVLRVTPARDGALRIEAPTREPMVVTNARRGVAVGFAIPPEATMVRVSFGARNLSVDALSRAANQPVSSGSSGSVPMSADAPNGPVSIEIPLK